MEIKDKFTSQVLLIDAGYIDRVATDLRRHFSTHIGRPLPPVDLSVLLECLALDAGFHKEDSKLQVIFLYEDNAKILKSCTPASLDTALNNVAFQGKYSEFLLSSFPTNDLVGIESLYQDMLQVIANAAEVKELLIIPHEQQYLPYLWTDIEQIAKDKKVILFGMNPPTEQQVSFEMLGFSVLRALGVSPSEI